MRELRVEDALLYLDQVKVEFGDRPHIYNEFLDIMKTFKTQQIDTPGVIRRVSNLFQGNKKLVLGFNTFLPEGYKIELDGDGPPVAVFRAPGETVTHILSGPGSAPAPAPGPPAAATEATNEAQQKPQAASVASRPVVPPLVAGQAQLHGGPPIPHAPQSSLGPRGPLGQQQAGFVDQVASGATTFPQALHSQIGARADPRVQLGQPPSMMSAADAAAMARLEQQARGAGGPPMQAAGFPGITAQQQPGADPSGGAHMGMQQNQHGMHAPQAPQPQAAPAAGGAQPQQPLEFDHAINYVTTIKKRFSNEPETYKKFLEILHTYQKEQRGIKEVLEEVSVLFAEHPDLLKEFTYFLPDAVQAEAKAQLEQVAKEAEARKAAASKQAMMQAAQQNLARVPNAALFGNRAPHPSMSTPVASHMPQPHAPPAIPIPFGATQGRSGEREREIYRSAVYGSVSFAPSKPPRKSAPTVQQAAAKNGRPTMLPPLPRQPTTAESAFFERAKRHLSRRELAPDKPTGRLRHTPYTEFLKCLHLFGAGILNKDELVLLLKGLFVQGHAPKSGANAGGGASNSNIAHDAHELMKEFEEILVGRGPYARQESSMKDKSKFGAKRSRDFDFRDCDRPNTSYVMLPSDYPSTLFMSHTGQIDQDAEVLNDKLICVVTEATGSPEDYDALRIRRNAYEEAMFRIEDERFEVDMAIERNALAMRQIEPIAEEVAMLRENEEKDGQPIGRLQYRLNSRTLNSIQINAIGRIYGDNGDEVLEHLARNPSAVLPIVYQRLRQKDQEWRKQKSDLMAKWKVDTEANYEGSMDNVCYFNRRDVERSFSAEQLREECKRARTYCSSPEKRTGSAVSFGLSSPDRSAVLYEPYAVVEMKPDCPSHHHAVRLLSRQVTYKAAKSNADREKVGRIWTEFIVPFFAYPTHWVLDESRESFRGELNNFVVQYANGQRVKTAFGEGTILAYLEGDFNAGPRYRVKFPFGIGFVSPYAILHGVQNSDGAKYVRRDGKMEKDIDYSDKTEETATIRLDKKFKLLFGTDSIYLFLRLYSFLVSSLDEIDSFVRSNPSMQDPSSAYYNPMKSSEEKKETKLDFPAVMMNLQKVITKKLSVKDFESFCRRVSPEIVHKMAALPKLIEKCADMMVEVAKEDLLPQLYDFCQFSGADPIQLRSACLALSKDAAFRIQYNSTNGRLYFSHLPEGEELLTVPNGDDDDDDDDDEVMEDGEVVSDDDDVMDVEDEEEDLRQIKRMKAK